MINCIGDSHISILSGQSQILPVCKWFSFGNRRIWHGGSITAFKVGEKQEVINVCNSVPENEHLVLSFGEIDGRCRVGRESDPIANVALICERYSEFLRKLKNQNIALLSVTPCVMEHPFENWFNEDESRKDIFISTRGTLEERNSYKKLFNDTMLSVCESRGYGFIDVWDSVMGKRELYMDDIHLCGEKVKGFL